MIFWPRKVFPLFSLSLLLLLWLMLLLPFSQKYSVADCANQTDIFAKQFLIEAKSGNNDGGNVSGYYQYQFSYMLALSLPIYCEKLNLEHNKRSKSQKKKSMGKIEASLNYKLQALQSCFRHQLSIYSGLSPLTYDRSTQNFIKTINWYFEKKHFPISQLKESEKLLHFCSELFENPSFNTVIMESIEKRLEKFFVNDFTPIYYTLSVFAIDSALAGALSNIVHKAESRQCLIGILLQFIFGNTNSTTIATITDNNNPDWWSMVTSYVNQAMQPTVIETEKSMFKKFVPFADEELTIFFQNRKYEIIQQISVEAWRAMPLTLNDFVTDSDSKIQILGVLIPSWVKEATLEIGARFRRNMINHANAIESFREIIFALRTLKQQRTTPIFDEGMFFGTRKLFLFAILPRYFAKTNAHLAATRLIESELRNYRSELTASLDGLNRRLRLFHAILRCCVKPRFTFIAYEFLLQFLEEFDLLRSVGAPPNQMIAKINCELIVAQWQFFVDNYESQNNAAIFDATIFEYYDFRYVLTPGRVIIDLLNSMFNAFQFWQGEFEKFSIGERDQESAVKYYREKLSQHEYLCEFKNRRKLEFLYTIAAFERYLFREFISNDNDGLAAEKQCKNDFFDCTTSFPLFPQSNLSSALSPPTVPPYLYYRPSQNSSQNSLQNSLQLSPDGSSPGSFFFTRAALPLPADANKQQQKPATTLNSSSNIPLVAKKNCHSHRNWFLSLMGIISVLYIAKNYRSNYSVGFMARRELLSLSKKAVEPTENNLFDFHIIFVTIIAIVATLTICVFMFWRFKVNSRNTIQVQQKKTEQKLRRRPQLKQRSKPYSQHHSQPYSQTCSQLNSQPISQSLSQLNSQQNSQPNSQQNSQQNSQLNSKLYSQLNSQPNSQQNSNLKQQYSKLKPDFDDHPSSRKRLSATTTITAEISTSKKKRKENT